MAHKQSKNYYLILNISQVEILYKVVKAFLFSNTSDILSGTQLQNESTGIPGK